MTVHANEGTTDILVDALIAAGSAFFAYLTVGGLTQDPRAALVGAGIAMALAFFGSLAAARRRAGRIETSTGGGVE